MIETALFFVLGFFCAGFLALMVAPAIWRRAVAITRRRIEASTPMTMEEIQADKDRLRAEFAMATRRLEREIAALKQKDAGQVVELSRNEEEFRRLAEERDERNRQIAELGDDGDNLRERLRQTEERLEAGGRRIAELEQALDEKLQEMQKLERLYEDASYSSSSRQIELVARETEVEKLSGDIGALRTQRREADRRVREVASENKSLRDTLRAEQRKVSDLERRVEQMITALSDREDRLDRREKELARLREQIKTGTGRHSDLQTLLDEERDRRVKLEADVERLNLALAAMPAASGEREEPPAPAAGPSDERRRMEDRLKLLTRENRRLRAELDAQAQAVVVLGDAERQEDAALREQIGELAAEVVHLTSTLDGPDSPIRRVLENGSAEPPGGATSLADRVRALQKAKPAR